MSFNERIAKIIEYSNLTPSEFADKIDVQRSSISHITSGRNKPSLDFIIKIKSHFPELLWDWLVTGKGEMLETHLSITETNKETDKEEKIKTTPLSDIFTMMNDDRFEDDKTEDTSLISDPQKTVLPPQSKTQEKISDSQQLENNNEQTFCPITGNQSNNIKRIVLFYENGKFESFEP